MLADATGTGWCRRARVRSDPGRGEEIRVSGRTMEGLIFLSSSLLLCRVTTSRWGGTRCRWRRPQFRSRRRDFWENRPLLASSPISSSPFIAPRCERSSSSSWWVSYSFSNRPAPPALLANSGPALSGVEADLAFAATDVAGKQARDALRPLFVAAVDRAALLAKRLTEVSSPIFSRFFLVFLIRRPRRR